MKIDADKLKAEIKKRINELDHDKYLSVDSKTARIAELHFIDRRINSLQQEHSSISFNLDEATAKYIESQTPADQGEEMIIYNAFKAGAEAITNQRVSLGYLISWYIQSVDGHQPIWTEEHLKELDKDFILIPKLSNNH